MKIKNRIKNVIAVLLSGVLLLGLDAGSFPGSTVHVQAMNDTAGPGAVASAMEEQSSKDTVDVYAGSEDVAVQGFGGWHNSSHSLCNDENCSDGNHELPEGASWTGVSELSDDMAAGYYYLTADVTLTAGWTPADGVVLCMNGKSITVDEDGEAVIYVEIARTVTICDCSNGGAITHSKQEDGTTPKRGSGVRIKGGTFNMYGGTISGNYVDSDGSGVYIGAGTFNMYGGTISGNEAFDNGGGVYLEKDTCVFNMYGGTINGNTATENGGGVHAYKGTFNMQNGTISDNTAKNGGGVYVNYSEATFVMYDGEIKDNRATGTRNAQNTSTYDGGGGVYCSVGTFTMKGGKISGNEATCGGGVKGNFTMTGGKIIGNTATNGGGVYTGGKVSYMSGTAQISGNKAKLGAGVYVSGGDLRMSGGTIGGTEADDANIATESGGGVYLYEWNLYYVLELSGGKIIGNEAVNGGGVYLSEKIAARMKMTGGEVSGNKATGTGGGVYMNTESELLLTAANDAQIRDNRVDGKLNNVYLPQGRTIYIIGNLTGNNSIGVTLATMPTDGSKVVVAESKLENGSFASEPATLKDTDANAFFSDAGSEYYATLDSENNNIFMAETPHEHYLCGGVDACNEVGGHKCEDKTTFTKWTSATDLPTSGTYYLTQDVTLSTQVELTGNLILDLNGHSITSEYNDAIGGAIKVNDSTHTLTLTDCNGSNSTHTFKKNVDNGNRWEPDTDGTGTITVTGGVITHSQGVKGSGIWVEYGSLVMYSGTICGNETTCGGAGVHVGYSTFTMYGGAIRGNYESSTDSTGGGVLVCTDTGSFTMYGGEISENTAKFGGGVSNDQSTFTMNGGKIRNNTATEKGGGVYSESKNFIMNDGEISGNEATAIVSGNGGGVCVKSGSFTMAGGRISNNTTKAYGSRGGGGGVFVGHTAKFTMTAGEINGNTAPNGSGGGVFVSGNTTDEKGIFEMTGGTISGNTSKGSNSEGGDGVAVDYYAEFVMSGGAISQNGATGSSSYGGGVYDNGTFTMSGDAMISGNTGKYGGVYVTSGGKFIMSDGTITGNNGTDGGAGGVYIFPNDSGSSRMTVSGAAKIYDNRINGTASNLYIPDGSTTSNLITIGKMTIGEDGAKIGVSKGVLPTKDTNIEIGVGDTRTTHVVTDNDAKAFFADAGDEYCIMKAGASDPGYDQALYLAVKPHEHNWSYTVKDDTITATCSADGCDVGTTSLKILPPDSRTLTYDGTGKEATIEYEDTDFLDLTGLDEPIIEYKQRTGPNNTLAYGSLPTEAGSYTATASIKIAEGSYIIASVDFEITKADLRATDFTFKAPADLIYSGTAKNAAVTLGKVNSGITVKYYNENGQAVDEAKNVGTYTVKIDVAESTNCKAASDLTRDSWKFTITPATITVTPDAGQNKVYGDSDPVIKYTFTGAASGETPTFDGALSKGSTEDAGEYDIVIGSLKLANSETFTAGNYQLELNSPSVKFTITPKNVTITGLKAENKTYDGTTDATVTGTPVLEGLVSGDENFVTIDSSGVTAEFEDKNAGTGKKVVSGGYSLGGIGAGNYSLTNPTVELTADITPKELTINYVFVVRKTYDGNTSADVSVMTLDGCVNNESLVFQWDFTARAEFDTADVGADKKITVTAELYNYGKSRNYTFAEGADKYIVTDGEIEKATVTAPADVELVVISGATKTYKITLPGLPTLEAPREYGKCEYTVDELILNNGYEGTAAISSDGTELTLNITSTGSDLGNVGTIKVTAKTDNYEDITLTVNVRATDKIVPQLEGEVTLSPAEITYGNALSGITITGKMTDGNNTSVPGKFEWQNPTDVLSVGTHNNVAWKFTPDDNQTYEPVTGGATVIVNRVAQSGTVSMAGYTYNDTPSKPALIDRAGDQNAKVTYYYSTDNTNSGGMEWKNIRPDTLNAGTYYMYAVIAETTNYSGYTTPAVKFEVWKIASTGEPKYTKITTGGKTLADAQLTLNGSTITPAAGTLEWIDDNGNVLPLTTKVEADKIYRWRFTPADANYTILTGEVELTVPGSFVPEYSIISGADSTWLQDTNGNLVISGNGEYSKFCNVKVDGVVIDAKNYTVAEGSTIVTLKAEYLKTLSEGSHTFEIVWSDGSAATSFVVKSEASGNDGTPGTTSGNGKNNSGTTVPAMGDDSNPGLWITLLVAALAGLAVLLVSGKKNKKQI